MEREKIEALIERSNEIYNYKDNIIRLFLKNTCTDNRVFTGNNEQAIYYDSMSVSMSVSRSDDYDYAIRKQCLLDYFDWLENNLINGVETKYEEVPEKRKKNKGLIDFVSSKRNIIVNYGERKKYYSKIKTFINDNNYLDNHYIICGLSAAEELDSMDQHRYNMWVTDNIDNNKALILNKDCIERRAMTTFNIKKIEQDDKYYQTFKIADECCVNYKSNNLALITFVKK